MQRRTYVLILAAGLIVLLIFFPSLNEIGAGVGIFLLGILNLERGFNIFTQGPVRKIIRKATDNMLKSILLGTFITALLNSSSLVSILVISFLSSGLITLKAGVGIIFGSNLGSTFTGWLIALFGLNFEISSLAMPMIILGVFFVLQKAKSMRGWGYVILGPGLLFLGIHYLKNGFIHLDIDTNFFGTTELDTLGMLTFTGIGILITIILQSSAATLALILTALASAQISYQEGLSLVIGANIGTTFTALLGSVASGLASRKIAMAHLIFNSVTAILILLFLTPVNYMISILGDRLSIPAENITLRLALFHTVFNTIGLFLMTPWINPHIRFLNWLIHEKEDNHIIKPKFLNKNILIHPQSTIHALLKETEHLLDHTFEIIAHGLNTHRRDIISVDKISVILDRSRDSISIDIDEEYLLKVKFIYSKIIEYASVIQLQNLSKEEEKTISNIIYANRLIVSVIKDLQEFRVNLNASLDAENEHIRNTYDLFRKRLLKIVRELFVNIVHYPYQKDAFEGVSHAVNGPQLKKIKENIRYQRKKMDDLEREINEEATLLLTRNLIESRAASSIINDSVYVRRIGSSLLVVLELLYDELSDLNTQVFRN